MPHGLPAGRLLTAGVGTSGVDCILSDCSSITVEVGYESMMALR